MAKSIGETIDEMQKIRDEKRDLEAQVKDLNAKYKELEEAAIEALKKSGLEGAKGELATASLSVTEVPTVADWTKLMRFIKKEAAYHLFERRIAKSAWQEMVANRKGKPLPGVDSFEKTSLNLRTR